ncbi:hypothetical protein NMY22_g19146 [Coprinellus aureogranulatus]|nr:hypothetical protein NMY22_g19146 [Coprinellus aureogranulatus]
MHLTLKLRHLKPGNTAQVDVIPLELWINVVGDLAPIDVLRLSQLPLQGPLDTRHLDKDSAFYLPEIPTIRAVLSDERNGCSPPATSGSWTAPLGELGEEACCDSRGPHSRV